MKYKRQNFLSKIIIAIILATFLTAQVLTPSIGLAADGLGALLGNSFTVAYAPPVLLVLKVHPENPLLFDFIVDRGQTKLSEEQFKAETQKLVEYFFAALTIPDKEVWVNLSPYEKDRIIPDVLGKTQMGKTMLEQDYVLKQLAASLTNPDTQLGKKYWDAVNKAKMLDVGRWTLEKTTSVQPPMSIDLNKVWIVPAKAKVLENNGIVVVDEKRLKVMMAEDRSLDGQRSVEIDAGAPSTAEKTLDAGRSTLGKKSITNVQHPTSNVSSDIFRTTILPSIEKEINEGKDFSAVRQVYNSVILAAWYKQALKESLLGKVYTDKAKVAGIETDDKEMKQRIYEQYLAAFKKGAYNFIKEEEDADGDLIPRKYFSGGALLALTGVGSSPLEVQKVSSSAVEQPILRASASVVRVQGEEKKASAAILKADLSAIAASPIEAGQNLYRLQFSAEFLDEPSFGLEQLEKVYLRSFAGEMAVTLAQRYYLNHSQRNISFSGEHFKASIREKNYELASINKFFEEAGNKVFAALENNPELAKKYQKEIAEIFASYFWQVYHLPKITDQSLDPAVDLTVPLAIRGIERLDKKIAILGAGLQGFVAMTEYPDKEFLLVDQNPFVIFSLAKYKQLTANPSVILEVDFTAENLITDNGLNPIFDRIILSRVLHEAGRTYVAPNGTEGNREDEVKINSVEAQKARKYLIKNAAALLKPLATIVVREVLDTPEIPYAAEVSDGIRWILPPRTYTVKLTVGETAVASGDTVVSVAGIVGTIQRSSSAVTPAQIDAVAKKIVGTLEKLDLFQSKISNLSNDAKGNLEKFVALLLTKALPPLNISNPTVDQLNAWTNEAGIKRFSTAQGVLSLDAMMNQYLGYQFENGGVSVVPQVILQEIKQLTASTPAAANLTEEPKKVGGINFDPTLLNLQIKRDGSGVPLPLPQQNIENINIEGLFPVIINIQPVNVQTLPVFLGKESQNSLLEV